MSEFAEVDEEARGDGLQRLGQFAGFGMAKLAVEFVANILEVLRIYWSRWQQ
jgi:hypothetical protein